ncbi:MAG: TolC family protein, partial [Opitutales bacterium]
AEAALAEARAGRRPSVHAFARAGVQEGFRREGSGDSWTAGLAVNWPLFDGFATRAEVRAASTGRALAEETTRRLELALHLDFEEAQLRHELASAQLELADRRLARADEAAALARQRFAAGLVLSTELINAETRLIEARAHQATARLEERGALAHLRRVAGQPILP